MNMLISWIFGALVILATGYLLPGVTISGFGAALVVAVVLGFLNAFIKPLLVALTLPINIVTLGLFTWVINAALILLTSAIVPGFRVDGFVVALLFGLIMALMLYILNTAVPSTAATAT